MNRMLEMIHLVLQAGGEQAFDGLLACPSRSCQRADARGRFTSA